MTELLMPKPRLSFSKKNPFLQTAWDSVSLGAAKACWRKYYLQIVLGFSPKRDKHHLRFGQLYHRALEVYDHHTFAGKSHDDALLLALRDLREGCTEIKDGKKVWWNPHENLSEETAKRDKKTVINLFRTVVWYLDEFGFKDSCKTIRLANGKPAVEISFRYELGFKLSTGEEALHSGHMDRLVDLNGLHYVLDRKTTAASLADGSATQYFKKYKPDNQMGGYNYAGQVTLKKPTAGIIIDAAQIAEGFSRFRRAPIPWTAAEADEWRKHTLWYISVADRIASDAAEAASRGWDPINEYPMNDTACDLYGGCTFRDSVCSKDPRVRQMYLESDFIQRPWDPLQTRGDI